MFSTGCAFESELYDACMGLTRTADCLSLRTRGLLFGMLRPAKIIVAIKLVILVTHTLGDRPIGM